MTQVVCESCGSNDLYEENGYLVCRYCGTRFIRNDDEKPVKEPVISLNEDVSNLLQKCKENPARAKKYAELILEIDPVNEEARRILGINSEKQGGCYIATCVYGSYDCPQVWTLRRFRDDILSETWYGRAFIHTYYAISPALVKCLGNTAWFKHLWKPELDRMVKNLNEKGVADTPYQDRY